MHSVTSDNDYVDPINGRFNSVEHMDTLIGQNRRFSFTFVKVGQYHSHCSPHSYTQGMVETVENFA